MNIKNLKSSALFRQYAAVFIVNLNCLTTGISMSWPSPMLVKLRDPLETQLTRPMSVEEGSWMVSLGFLGGALSYFVTGTILDALGRKKVLILSSILKSAMGLTFIFASSSWLLITARTIMIITDCYIFVVVSVYASEIADKNQRGTLGSFLQIFSSLGSLISLAIGPYLSYKIFNIIFTSLIVITSLPLFLLSESPFYLYKKGHTEEAMNVLKKIRKSDTITKQEIEEFRISCEKMNQGVNKIKVFQSKLFLKSLSLGILLNASGQLCGFNAVMYYLQTILLSTKTQVKSEFGSVIIGIIQFIGAACTILITSRFGRRTILLSFHCGICLGMIGLGTFFKISEANDVTGFLNYVPIISIIFVIFSYSAGVGTLTWLITPELFDSHPRAVGVSVSYITTAFLIFLTTKYFPSAISTWGPAITYWFFAVVTAIFVILLALYLPETKDKSFNEIQMELENTNQER